MAALDASPRTPELGTVASLIYAHLGLDGVSEGIAVGVLTYEGRVDDVRGVCGESCDAARRADRCSPVVGIVALVHARHHPMRRAVRGNLPGTSAGVSHRRFWEQRSGEIEGLLVENVRSEVGTVGPNHGAELGSGHGHTFHQQDVRQGPIRRGRGAARRRR